MATEIAALTALVPPPAHAERRDWAAAEATLQTTLPADYKSVVDTYGDGLFFDTLRLWTPTQDQQSITIAGPGEVDGFLSMIREDVVSGDDPDYARLPDGQLQPVDLGDAQSSPPYLSWGVGEGDVGFWHRTSDDPNAWPILFGQLQAWDYHPDGLLAYLVGIITGDLESSCFAEPQTPTFTSFTA